MPPSPLPLGPSSLRCGSSSGLTPQYRSRHCRHAETSADDLESLLLTTTARRTLQGELPKRRPDGEIDRSASLVQLARVLYGAGVPVEEIPGILAERDESLGWRKYTERVDAQQQYERIIALIERRG